MSGASPAALHRSWRRNFRFVWLANFLTAVGMTTFLRLFPLHLRELGLVDESAIAWWSGALVAAAPLTAAVMGPVWGALGDRIGRKPMMQRANLAITLFTLLMWFAHTPWLLLVLRLLQGTFSGFVAPAMTLVSVSAPSHRQGRVAGLLHTSVLAGTIVGPWLGGRIGDHFAYRHAFLVCAATSLLAFPLIQFRVEEHARPAVVDGSTSSTVTKTSLSAALRALLADAREFLAPGPLRTMVAGVFVVRGAAVLADPLLALFVGSLAGVPAARVGTTTGVVAAATAIATLLVMPAWGRRGDDRGHARLLVVCGVGAAACVAPQFFVTSLWQLCALSFGSGVFLAGVLPSAYGLAARLSPIERRGAANGFMFSAIGLANAVGPLLGGAIGATIGVRRLYLVASGLMLVGTAWLWLRVRQTTPTAAVESEVATPTKEPAVG